MFERHSGETPDRELAFPHAEISNYVVFIKLCLNDFTQLNLLSKSNNSICNYYISKFLKIAIVTFYGLMCIHINFYQLNATTMHSNNA